MGKERKGRWCQDKQQMQPRKKNDAVVKCTEREPGPVQHRNSMRETGIYDTHHVTHLTVSKGATLRSGGSSSLIMLSLADCGGVDQYGDEIRASKKEDKP